jgi:hypothetical protein
MEGANAPAVSLFRLDQEGIKAEARGVHMNSIKKEVDRLFSNLRGTHRAQCQNPVTGGWFLWGIDPIAVQKRKARRALAARRWCAENDPPDLPPLPIRGSEIFDMQVGQGLLHLFAYYARSLADRDWVVEGHPSFDEYARGMLASPHGADFFKRNKELMERFPPRPLAGLGVDNVWRPPEDAKTIHKGRRRQARKSDHQAEVRRSA